MCFICDRIKMINNGTNPYFVKELQTGYVVIGDNQHFKGYTLFLCKEHKTELFQLNHSKKIKFLNKEIDSQKQKIETHRSALANAAESFGENDRRTQSRQIQLNNAQAALNGIDRKLSSNNSALEKTDKSFDEAGDGTGFLILSH